MEQIVQSLGYVGIALLMFIENIFPPIPSEVVMPFAGSLAAQGEMSFVGALAAGTVGAFAGAVAIYYIGVWVSESRARSWFQRYGRYLLMSEEDFDKALNSFNKHGQVMVFVGRLMPGIRSLISLPAGLDRMNLGIFLLLTVLGTTLWNIILAYAGLVLGENWRTVINWVDTYGYVVYGILGILIIIFIVNRVRD
jgi:membrane protein DedA with SNARE-associated domain